MKKLKYDMKFVLHGIMVPILILVAAATLVLWIYFFKISEASEKRAYRLLAEAAKTLNVAMAERKQSSFQQLNIIAHGINWDTDIYNDEEVLRDLKTLADESLFANIAITDKRGTMLYQNGNTADCSDRPYFKDAMDGKMNTQFLKSGRMSGDTVFVFAVPVRQGGEIIGAIIGTRNLTDILSVLSFQDEIAQYNFLCNGDGRVVSVPSGDDLGVSVGGMLGKYFKVENGEVQTDDNQVCKYNYNGNTYYGIYTHSGLDDIFIFSIVGERYASSLAGLYSKLGVMVTAIIFLFTMIAAAVVIIRLKRRITIVKGNELERRKRLEEYHNFQSRRLLDRTNVLGAFNLNLTKNTVDKGGELLKRLTGRDAQYSVEDLCDIISERIHPSDRERYIGYMSREALMLAAQRGKSSVQNDFLFYNPGGRYIWLRVIADLVKNPITGDYEALVYAIGINNTMRLEQIGKKLIRENFEAMGLIDVESGRVFGIKALGDGDIMNNHGLKSGLVYDSVAQAALANYLSEYDFKFVRENIRFKTVKEKLETAQNWSVTVHSCRMGGDRYYKIKYSYLDGEKESIVVSCEDITDILASKMDIETGLYNSAGFHEKVTEWLKENPGKKYRMYRYNLDGFSNINGTYGYEAGNKVLRDIAKHMRARSTDSSFAAHLNADHFVRFCSEDYPSAEECYKKFLSDFADYEIHYPLTIHVGVYDLCEEDCDSFTMSYKAHLALQSIKGDLATHIAYYKKGLMQATKNQQELIADVENAVKDGQFEVWLQPQFNYSGALVGAEALTRWRHPEKGLIMPADFVPLLEKSRQITLVDKFVWDKCCEYIKILDGEGIKLPLSVNASRIDIRDKNVCPHIEDMAERHGISHGLLRLEITESAYLTETEELKSAVTAFKNAGFAVEMDDFGSGYSSLNILLDLDIDILKIDKKLVSKAGIGDEKSDSILRAVANMAKSLKISVIAEGVENKTQADFLNSVGCTDMQGYYYAKPMTFDKFKEFIKNKRVDGLQ